MSVLRKLDVLVEYRPVGSIAKPLDKKFTLRIPLNGFVACALGLEVGN